MAAQLGFCGLDVKRKPLTGDEIRPCWEAADANAAAIPALPGVGAVWPLPADDGTAVRPLEFVEVPPKPGQQAVSDPAAPPPIPAERGSEPFYSAPTAGGEPGWSLWGEPDS